MNIRLRFFYYLVNNIWCVPEGSCLPVILIKIRRILFPLQPLIHKCGAVKYDAVTDVYTINGIRITGQTLNMIFKRKGCFLIEIESTNETIRATIM
jgi:hypothetical protein